jgi:hypothetical protein
MMPSMRRVAASPGCSFHRNLDAPKKIRGLLKFFKHIHGLTDGALSGYSRVLRNLDGCDRCSLQGSLPAKR